MSQGGKHLTSLVLNGTLIGSTSTGSSVAMLTSNRPSRHSLLSSSKDVTGRSLFSASVRTELSQKVSAEREAKGLSSKHHVGMLNALEKEAWDALEQQQQEEWVAKGKSINEGEADVYA